MATFATLRPITTQVSETVGVAAMVRAVHKRTFVVDFLERVPVCAGGEGGDVRWRGVLAP